MQKISWTDRARNQVLRVVKQERNILPRFYRRKANWIFYTLLRNVDLNMLLKER